MSSEDNSLHSSESQSAESSDSSLNSERNSHTWWGEKLRENSELITKSENDRKILEIIEQSALGNERRERRPNIERNSEQGYDRLYADYFSPNPVYSPQMFRLRFRMHKPLFLRIVEAVTATDPYFQQRRDAAGKLGLSNYQKCTAAIRILGYGYGCDAVDEYLRLSQNVARKSLIHFVEGVISNFGSEYLRRPTEADLARLLHMGEEQGFPGMMGSIDCMHWQWKNCPAAWAGQYSGRHGKPTVVLEAVASSDLWIWHAFFGTPGSLNDINVLDRSPVFDDILNGRAPSVSYVVNGRQYKMGYYLTDGIYPAWATFVKAYPAPQLLKESAFNRRQEAVRKDVERAFGVLQARFAFIRRPSLIWDRFRMSKIIIACIIMHNMIVEDERDTYATYYDPTEFLQDLPTPTEVGQVSTDRIASLANYMANKSNVKDSRIHYQLRQDLTDHIFQKYGSN